MNRFVPKILLATTCACLTGTAGRFIVLRPNASFYREEFVRDVATRVTDLFKNPNDEVGNGTEVCARCGEVRDVVLKRGGKRDFVRVDSAQQSWAEAHIGACVGHLWQRTGCWYGRYGVSCYMTAYEHILWRALANLDDEHADQMAHRFASLTKEQQLELFSSVNFDEGSDKVIARRAAENAGWCDLADFWAD